LPVICIFNLRVGVILVKPGRSYTFPIIKSTNSVSIQKRKCNFAPSHRGADENRLRLYPFNLLRIMPAKGNEDANY